MIRFSCPKCKTVLQTAAGQAGATVGCPRCKFQMQVPSAAPVAKAPPQPAGPTPDWLNDMRAEQRADQRPPAVAPTSAAPTAAPWHFTRDGKKYGPYTTAQLKQFAGSGRLLPTDLVWKDGVEGGKPASAVKGLFPAKPPPSQPAAQPKPAVSTAADLASLTAPKASLLTKAKRQWDRLSRKVKLGIVGGAVVVPLLLVLVIVLVVAGKSGHQGGSVAQNDGGAPGSKEAGKKSKVELPDFSKLDYTKGPKGEKLETREMKAQSGQPLMVQGFVDEKGDFIQHGRMYLKCPNGQLCEESYYFNGKEHGPHKVWYESGEKWEESYYVDDKLHGPLVRWSKDGKMLLNVTFDHGRYDREDQTRAVFVMVLGGSNSPDNYAYTGGGTLAEIIETFGKPDQDRAAPGEDERFNRLWTYRCKDGNLTMWVFGGPFYSWDGKGGKTPLPGDEVKVTIHGEDNFPSVEAPGSARNLSIEEFRRKVGGMMTKGNNLVDTRIWSATCDARSFFQEFGFPDESVQKRDADNSWFCHRYSLRDGSIWLYLMPAGKNVVQVMESKN